MSQAMRRLTKLLLVGASSTLGPACSSAVPEENTENLQQEIIGGYNAISPVLNHTGVLLADFGGQQEPFCTASLVGETTVITAKHCGEILLGGFPVYFGIGPDAAAPVETIAVVALANAPSDVGGFVERGQDVAILHLDHAPITAVQAVVPRPSNELVLGQRMVSIGYGVFGATGAFDGQRRIGRESVTATEGLVFEHLLGDFEGFVEWVFTGALSDEDWLEILAGDPVLDELLTNFESTVLLDEDEAVTGLAAGDTQSCHGDSGGPLMGYNRIDRQWETYGVVSGGLYSARAQCDFGTVFATFGPEVMAFIESEQDWVDPCGDVGAAGDCAANVASNCATDIASGVRELQQQDCSVTEEVCVLSAGGAACGVAVPAEEPPSGPGPEAVRRRIAEGFHGAAAKFPTPEFRRSN